MSITKTKAGTYQVSVFYPKAVRELMGVAGQTRFRETISTKQAAVAKEREINKKIKEAPIVKLSATNDDLSKNWYR